MIHCPYCDKPFDVSPTEIIGARLFCDRCRKIFGLENLNASDGKSRVLVVHENDGLFSLVDKIVESSGFVSVRAKKGNEALELAKKASTSLVLVDVAISDMLVHELIASLKALEKSPRIALLASVYDKSAYKRAPKTLHGADDYLEQHQLSEKLPTILQSLLTAIAENVGTKEDLQQTLRRSANQALASANSPEERARALARRLVLDISVYHEEEFLAAMQTGTVRERLKDQIAEAKRFLAEKLLATGQGNKADAQVASRVIEDALDELMSAKGDRI